MKKKLLPNEATREINVTSGGIKLVLKATSMIAYRNALIEELWSVQTRLKNQYSPNSKLTIEEVEMTLSIDSEEAKKLF